MNKKNLTTAFALSLLFAKGVMASVPTDDKGDLDLSTIVYIEDEEVIDLGFDTADYLPEDFDPYDIYVDLNSVTVVQPETKIDFDSKANLPAHFDAYSYPMDVESINYIDADDTVTLDFDTAENLPEGFDPFSK